jgi:hypothetical protein
MYIIFISLLFIIFFFFVLLVGLNYIIYHWENNKILMLTKSDTKKGSKPLIDDTKKYLKDVTKSTQAILNITTTKSTKLFGRLYNQTTIDMPNRLKIHNPKPGSYDFTALIHKCFDQTKRFALFFISLTKPATIESDEYIETVEAENVSEVAENANHDIDNVQHSRSNQHSAVNNTQAVKSADYQEEKEEATIGLIGIGANENAAELSTFDKLEARLLTKLKESGMSNYDIWLELGDLYLKYNESKKAMEIYALVLKHSKNEKHKELARNGLIGI